MQVWFCSELSLFFGCQLILVEFGLRTCKHMYRKCCFVSMVYVISSVTVEVVRAVLVVVSIAVVSGKHKTLLDGFFLLQNEHLEHPGTFVLMLHWLRKHDFSELSVEYPLQFMSWSHSDLHIFSLPLNVLYGYKTVEDKMGELYPTAWTKKAEMYTFIIWDRIWSNQNMIPQVHVFLIRRLPKL